MEAEGGHPSELKAAERAFKLFVRQTYLALVRKALATFSMNATLPIFCRMDVSWMVDEHGTPQYFVNEIEHGWQTDMFISFDPIYRESLTVMQVLGDALVDWAAARKAKILYQYIQSILTVNDE